MIFCTKVKIFSHGGPCVCWIGDIKSQVSWIEEFSRNFSSAYHTIPYVPNSVHLWKPVSLSSLPLPPLCFEWKHLKNKYFQHTKPSVVQTDIRSAKDYFLNDSQGVSFGQSKLCFRTAEKSYLRCYSGILSKSLLEILENVCPTT